MLEQIRSCGYDAVTMEGIAASTRCSKSTLYRQWKTKPQFVAAALRSRRGALRRHRHRLARRGPASGGRRREEAGKDTGLLQALGHAVMEDPELKCALREALVEPEIATLRDPRPGCRPGRGTGRSPALEYVPAQLFGMLRMRPVLEGEQADAEYLVRFVEAVVLPALGLP